MPPAPRGAGGREQARMVRQRSEERIELVNPGEGHSVLFDLSKGGACCLIARKHDKGDFVRIALESLVLRARITYCIDRTDGWRTGMQFWGVS